MRSLLLSSGNSRNENESLTANRKIKEKEQTSTQEGGGGVKSHMKREGVLVVSLVSLRGVNFGFWRYRM